jgi:hypothetical protein
MAIEMSEVFWSFFITSIIGLMLAIGKMCYKSKCSQIEICCIKVTRNIEAEVKEDLAGNESQPSHKRQRSFSGLELGESQKTSDESQVQTR